MSAVVAAPRPAAPDDLHVRIIGTASFQGRQTALIEDLNTRSDSFYKLGDPIYGYKITAIANDGLFLEKLGRTYFVEFSPSQAVRPADNQLQSSDGTPTYLPGANAKALEPYLLAEVAPTTQWDLWALTASIPKAALTGFGGRFALPIASFRRLSSGFGYRVHPIRGGKKMHKGIDLAARKGTKILAADAGTVVKSGWNGGYGYCIILDHHNGFKTTYGHCSKLIADVGDNVQRGEYIAEVGSTGASTGPHLHFEVHKGGTAVNPVQYFKELQ